MLVRLKLLANITSNGIWFCLEVLTQGTSCVSVKFLQMLVFFMPFLFHEHPRITLLPQLSVSPDLVATDVSVGQSPKPDRRYCEIL